MDLRKTFSKILAHAKKWKWEMILAVAGMVITIIAIFLTPFITREFLSDVYKYLKATWFPGLVVLVVLGLIAYIVKLLFDRRRLKRELEMQGAFKFKRFETIRNNKIKYGHVEFYPLVWYPPNSDNPKGVGIRLVEEIFGKSVITKYPRKGRWDELVDKLKGGEYDIVATPLYETRERSDKVAFCSPIFFSDIGVFVKPDGAIFSPHQKNSMTFEKAREFLSNLKDTLKFTAIDGELSGKMILKHLQVKKEKVNWLGRDESSVAGLIGAVEDDNMASDVVFAEVFQAEQTESVKNDCVINLLKPKELLYPVSFAVRKQEYVLKNFINLKLLEIDEKYKEGILEFILDELKKQSEFSHLDLTKIKRYFVKNKPSV